jgi:hypothetical protein
MPPLGGPLAIAVMPGCITYCPACLMNKTKRVGHETGQANRSASRCMSMTTRTASTTDPAKTAARQHKGNLMTDVCKA